MGLKLSSRLTTKSKLRLFEWLCSWTPRCPSLGLFLTTERSHFATWFMDIELESALHETIQNSNFVRLHDLLAAGVDPNHEQFTYYLEKERDFRLVGSNKITKCTPLQLAVAKNSSKAVDLLIFNLHRSLDIDKKCDAPLEATALHLAVSLSNMSMVERLLVAGANGVAIRNRAGLSPFEQAVDTGRLDIARTIFLHHKPRYKGSIIHDLFAAKVRVDILQLLIDLSRELRPWDMNKRDFNHKSPLAALLASYDFDNVLEVARTLLENKIFDQESLVTALEHSIRRTAPLSLVKLLLQCSDKPSAYRYMFRVDIDGIWRGSVTIVGLVLFYYRRQKHRQELLKLLVREEFEFANLSLRQCDLFHLAIMAPLSNVLDLEIIKSSGQLVRLSALRKAVSRNRLDLLGWLLDNVNSREVSTALPHMMSNLAFKARPVEFASVLVLLRRLKEQFKLDQNATGFYPLPLLHLMAFKYSIRPNPGLVACIQYICSLRDTNFELRARPFNCHVGAVGLNIIEYCKALEQYALIKYFDPRSQDIVLFDIVELSKSRNRAVTFSLPNVK